MANYGWITGVDLGKDDSSSMWIVWPRADGSVTAAPMHPPGFEGAGAQQFDGVESADILAASIKRLADWTKAATGGANVSNAISALHGQRRADGRPVPYLPEGGE